MHGITTSCIVALLVAAGGAAISLGNVGPDPAKWMLHESGFAALVFLVMMLAVSPASRALRRPILVLWRRPLGLAGFFLATLHVVTYLFFFQALDLVAILEDVVKRPYILIGLAAWLLLVPLAVTSTRNARRRMGKSWSSLHRAVYVIVPLAVLHQGMAQKADLDQTIIFFTLTACFLIERLVRAVR